MNTPMISVVMPVYNAEQYVTEAIESILNQTYSDFEFIIVDDCSTDNSYQILQSYANRDGRIKLYRNEINLKLPKTLNFGIEQAQGKYIARMDADDISLPERFAKQIEFMESHPEIGVCGTWFKAFMDSGLFVYDVCYATDPKRLLINMLFDCSEIGHPTSMIRKCVLDTFGVYNLEFAGYAEDYELWCRLLTQGVKFTNIPAFLLYYRLSETQITKADFNRVNESAIRILKNNYKLYFGRYISDYDINKFVYYKRTPKKKLSLVQNLEFQILLIKFKKINTAHRLFNSKYFNVLLAKDNICSVLIKKLKETLGFNLCGNQKC